MDLNAMKYQMFLAEQIEEQALFEACINESILMSSGENNLQNMQMLQESVVDKMKEGIMKIMEGLGKLWAKFIEAMDVLIKKDKTYLEKYKDTILKKKPINADYTMYNYEKGVANILRSPLPAFNYNTMKDELNDTETFINKYFSRYKLGDKDTNFIDGVKAYFRGSAEQKKINSSQINMTDLYNYCHDYDKMKETIQKDLKSVERSATDGLNLIEKMGRENKIAQESGYIFEDNKYFSLLYEQYITEEESKTTQPNNNDNKTNPNNPAASRTVAGSEANGTKPNSQYQKATGDNKEVKEDDVKDSTVKGATNRIKVYIKVCSDFIAAKLTICEEIYKAYMSIIKAHIRDHLGNKNGEDKSVDNASDYDKKQQSNNNSNAEENKKTTENNSSQQSIDNNVIGFFNRFRKNKEQK